MAGFNFSVRNGKRWSPRAIATLVRPVGKGFLRRGFVARSASLRFGALGSRWVSLSVIRLEKESGSFVFLDFLTNSASVGVRCPVCAFICLSLRLYKGVSLVVLFAPALSCFCSRLWLCALGLEFALGGLASRKGFG